MIEEITTKYDLTEDDIDRLRKWRHFRAHSDQSKRFIQINKQTKRLAQVLMEFCPRSRELDLAIDKLEEARLHANMAIMKNEPEES